MLRAIPIAVAAAIVASPAVAASFDCKLGKLPAEIAICADPTLSSEDEELASQYSALLKLAPADAQKTIRKEQKAWLLSRNACKSDMQCIMGRYRERLQRFGEWQEEFIGATAHAGAGPPGGDPNATTLTPAVPDNAAPAGDPTGDPD